MATLCLPVAREFLDRMACRPKLLESLGQLAPLDTIRDGRTITSRATVRPREIVEMLPSASF